LGVALAATSAAADPELRLSVDWGKFGVVLRDGAAALPWQDAPPAERKAGRSSESAGWQKWLGLSPHLSLVARDWSGAQVLVGHMVLTDELRTSRSSRMFVTRVRLADGRFAPFAHVGLGQWRVDQDLMPVLPRDIELATQLGAGFELSLSRGAALAIEGDHTLLIREQHEPQMVTAPYLWGAFVASRVAF
jgi:hypothetical protein